MPSSDFRGQSRPPGEFSRACVGASARSSRRRSPIKNRYGSTLEVLSHVQIWYVERETRELVRIQQADLLESFHKAQSDYASAPVWRSLARSRN